MAPPPSCHHRSHLCYARCMSNLHTWSSTGVSCQGGLERQLHLEILGSRGWVKGCWCHTLCWALFSGFRMCCLISFSLPRKSLSGISYLQRRKARNKKLSEPSKTGQLLEDDIAGFKAGRKSGCGIGALVSTVIIFLMHSHVERSVKVMLQVHGGSGNQIPLSPYLPCLSTDRIIVVLFHIHACL